jgi:hypothetical protein
MLPMNTIEARFKMLLAPYSPLLPLIVGELDGGLGVANKPISG